MQIIAILTMLVDHIGIVFFPDESIWRTIGRIAFPLYAFALVIGYYKTTDRRKYLLRLTVIAVLSQLPYQIGLDDHGVNVVGTLIICLLVLILLDRFRHFALALPVVAAAAILLETADFDYGYYGLALVLIYRYCRGHLQVFLHLILNIAVLFDKGWMLQLFSLFTTLTLVYSPQLYRYFDRYKPPRWVWRAFYPAHLSVLAVYQLAAAAT
ncbi:TraX family protein [Paenibacillus tarimensis]